MRTEWESQFTALHPSFCGPATAQYVPIIFNASNYENGASKSLYHLRSRAVG
jgi:hypothetical protein